MKWFRSVFISCPTDTDLIQKQYFVAIQEIGFFWSQNDWVKKCTLAWFMSVNVFLPIWYTMIQYGRPNAGRWIFLEIQEACMHSQPLSFKARVSIEHCIANVSIRIDCATSSTLFWLYFIIYKSKYVLFDNSRIFFFYRSDGELLEESKASISTGSAINNCKSGNFGTCSGTSWSRIRSLSSLSSVTSKRVIRGHSQNLIC